MAGEPFTATQILWINFLVDAPLGVALGFDKETPGLMQRRPRPRNASILTRQMLTTVGLTGFFMAALPALAPAVRRRPLRRGRRRHDHGHDRLRRLPHRERVREPQPHRQRHHGGHVQQQADELHRAVRDRAHHPGGRLRPAEPLARHRGDDVEPVGTVAGSGRHPVRAVGGRQGHRRVVEKKGRRGSARRRPRPPPRLRRQTPRTRRGPTIAAGAGGGVCGLPAPPPASRPPRRAARPGPGPSRLPGPRRLRRPAPGARAAATAAPRAPTAGTGRPARRTSPAGRAPARPPRPPRPPRRARC